jgi:hypothetical protein
MNSQIGRDDPCERGSGKKHNNCCGAPHGEVTSVRTKDLSVFELTPGCRLHPVLGSLRMKSAGVSFFPWA